MKKINRSLINFKPSELYNYIDNEKFSSSVMKNGIHSLKINNRWFDAGYETRGSDSLLICFHAAVGGHLKSSPVLSGRAVASC
ncbi:hypothetical protein KRR55_16545 [Paeniglutamicibacter sp. ABSL32-1]|uniref:hypothetical protein n=1 Tax=Paeniglutamicibacter quisquiliarum TaxID=2849498 RepID=UPI001C2D6202|nr:hypothetical protein [Paeniglutamicibacter quisquiliarum]MBV1780726.1 hypothetical protein [Paeniglutamicibacter quisquiliarum]